jgi:hypothetical protein
MSFKVIKRVRPKPTHQLSSTLLSHYFGTMKLGSAVLAVALVAAATNPVANACDAHGHHHNHSHSKNDTHTDNLCTEDIPNGLSDEIDGRRTVSRFRVGDTNWGTREAFAEAGARCVSSEPTRRQVRNSNEILDEYIKRFGSNRRLQAAKQIPVYFHVIKPTRGSGGDVSIRQIVEQITVLNNSFEGNFEFTLVEQKITNNDSYYGASIGTRAEILMKSSLRQGGANALNIYTSAPGGGVLGWSTFPDGVKSYSGRINSSDGIVIRFDTLPRGTLSPFNEGDTVVHEVGHWLGLFHTFQGGCSGDGDIVRDTPSEASPAFGCPAGRNVSLLYANVADV